MQNAVIANLAAKLQQQRYRHSRRGPMEGVPGPYLILKAKDGGNRDRVHPNRRSESSRDQASCYAVAFILAPEHG